MAISEAFSGTEAVSTTEWSLTADSSTIQTQTTDGIYQVVMDLNALANGDVYQFRGYEKARSGDTQRCFLEYNFAHAQTAPLWISDSFILLHGWDFTLKKISGTDRTITWSVRSVA